MAGPDRVVVPFINAPAERETLKYALESYPEAAVTIMGVRTPLDAPMIEGGFLSLEEAGRMTLKERIGETISEVEERDRITIRIAEGRPAPTVVDEIAASPPDRVVIRSPDRSRLERLLFGRTVAGIVDARTDVPVTGV